MATVRFLISRVGSVEVLTSCIAAGPWRIDYSVDRVICEHYLDTPDWELAQAGWSYVCTQEESQSSHRWLALGPSDEQLDSSSKIGRDSTTALHPFPGRLLPSGQESAKFQRLTDQLTPLIEVKGTSRHFQLSLADGCRMDLAIERILIQAARAQTAASADSLEFCQIYLGNLGSTSFHILVIHHLRERLGLIPVRLTNLERGWQLLGLDPHQPPVSIMPPIQSACKLKLFREMGVAVRSAQAESISPKAPAWRLVGRYLIENFSRLLAHESYAWEGLHPEGVHQMRVATRRLRAALGAFKQALTGTAVAELNSELKWLAAQLGIVRDLDVQLASVTGHLRDLPPEEAPAVHDYLQHLQATRNRAQAELVDCLSSWRYKQLVSEFGKALQAEALTCKSKASQQAASQAGRRLIKRQYKRVLKHGREINEDSRSVELHRLRIECKRLRYLFEIFLPVYRHALASDIKKLKKLQSLLGEHQDAYVAIQHIRLFSDKLPCTEQNRALLITCGQLIHCEFISLQNKRQDFAKVWKNFDRPKRLDKLVAKL